MENIMTKFFKSSILSSIGFAILGGLLFFQSEITIISISYVIGGILVAIGVITILKYIKNKKEGIENEIDILYGLVTSILGVLVITNPEAIASVIPFIIGFIMIISSAMKIQYSFELKNKNSSIWISTFVISTIAFICGLLLIFNPFKGAVYITRIIGIFIFTYAILDLISTLRIKRNINSIHKSLEEKVKEANVVEEKEEK